MDWLVEEVDMKYEEILFQHKTGDFFFIVWLAKLYLSSIDLVFLFIPFSLLTMLYYVSHVSLF